MSLGLLKLILKLIVLASALVSLAFAIALLFFYEQFQIFNEMTNTQYFTRKQGAQPGKGYLFDNWIMGWHVGFGLVALVVSIWLFWIFFSYISL
jgi:hypothetical protein